MIVDTSVIFDALVPGSLSAAARLLLTSSLDLRAPDLIAIEIPGALTKAVRRGAISVAFASAAHTSTAQVMPTLEPTGPLLDRSFALSLELTHPLHDCIFLAHAEARAMTLVTSDRRFSEKLKSTPHGRSIVHLADWTP